MTNARNQLIVKQFIALRFFYGGKCALCGAPGFDGYPGDPLEFAHIRETGLTGRSRGRKERYYDIINNLDCYRLMHRSCHKHYDEALNDE